MTDQYLALYGTPKNETDSPNYTLIPKSKIPFGRSTLDVQRDLNYAIALGHWFKFEDPEGNNYFINTSEYRVISLKFF